MKANRQEVILEIIATEEVYTQEGLQQKLIDRGFNVTQATVSRDLKNLDLIKVLTPDGRYRYSRRQEDVNRKKAAKFRSVFIEAVLSVDYAQNIVAVKCHVGMGNAACAAIDMMELEGIVGTLAGDDTVFILMRDIQNAAALTEKIKGMIEG